MKHSLLRLSTLAFAGLLFTHPMPASESAQGFVDFGTFTPPTNGGNFVEVHLKNNLISMVGRLAQKEAPEAAELLQGLQLIHVNVIALDDSNRAKVTERVQKIRRDLDAQGWERIVTAQKKGDDAAIFLKTRGNEAIQGLAVTLFSSRKGVVLANIVGDIRPEQLVTIGERFNIEPLKEIGRNLK